MMYRTDIRMILKYAAFFAVSILLCCFILTTTVYAQSAEDVQIMVDLVNKNWPMQNGQRANFNFREVKNWASEDQKKAFMKAAMKTGLQITGMSSSDKKLYENVYKSQRKDVSKDASFTQVMNEVLDNTKRDINLHGNNSQSISYETSADVAIDRLRDIMGESGLSATWKTALNSTGLSDSKYTDYKSYVYAYKELEDKIALNPIGGYTVQSSIEKDSVMAMVKRAKETLDAMKADGVITQKEYELEQNRITGLVNMTVSDIKDQIDQLDISEKGKQDLKERANEKKKEVVAEVMECSSIQYLKDKYLNSGCWACLVVERMASAFLTAASKAYSLAQKAGLVALMLGSVMWVLMWGIKNVSSLSQVETANVLNDLVKFGFKILLAYLFIIAGKNVVKNYITTPIMGTGAVIAQQFWTGQLKSGEHRLDDYLWEDEVVTPEQLEVIEKQIAANNAKKLAETPDSTATPAPDETPAEEATPVKDAEPIEYNSTEELIQDIQKSFIEVLRAQLSAIKNSCNGSCGDSCRFASCTNAGHMNAVKKIHSDAGSSFGGNVAYCQAAITAAMNNLTKLIGGDVTTVLKDVASGCALGLNRGAKSENGFSAVGKNGEDVDLCIQGNMVPNLKLNIGDTIYYHKVTSASGEAHKMGASSGYHAVTYSGQNQTISFNGDGAGTMCNSYYYNVQGKVLCVSCLIREKLEKNPKLADGIDKNKLAELASGFGDMTLINYKGGIYPPATGGEGTNDASLLIKIPDVNYMGPTDILSKVIMDNILKATKVITDNTAENMVLGDAIMCCAKLDSCGAWNVGDLIGNSSFFKTTYLTNWWMWLQGGLIFATGFLLTLAVAYYLIDISFKVGFAVIALPIVVGLWPFKLTSGKFTNCVSIIAKASATYAFLGFTTYFAVKMIGYNFATDGTGNLELSMTYKVIQCAMDGGVSDVCQNLNGINDTNDPTQYLTEKLQLFSISFIILMFCLIYAFIIVQKSTTKLVDKFFPDNVFGGTAPMHKAATGATKAVKDLAMKPVKWAADVATYQGTKYLGRKVRNLMRGKGGSSDGGGTGRAIQKGGKATQKAGQTMSKAGDALNKTKFGMVLGVPLKVAGKITETSGKMVEQTGKLAEQAGKKFKAAKKKMKKALSRVVKRRNHDNK